MKNNDIYEKALQTKSEWMKVMLAEAILQALEGEVGADA